MRSEANDKQFSIKTSIRPLIQSPALKTLLQQCELDASNLDTASNVFFLGCHDRNELIGCVGLEIYDDTALLRSLAVSIAMQRHGLGAALVKAAETYATGNGIKHLFLLTVTAEAFFEHLGYQLYPRQKAPVSIATTSQFSDLCPASSAFMYKSVTVK